MKKRVLIFFAVFAAAGMMLAGLFAFSPAQAQSDLQTQTGAFAGPEGAGFVERGTQAPEDPRYLIGLFIKVAVSLLTIAMVAYLIYGGYLIMTSAGEEEKIKKGRKTMITALIGAVIILSAYSITRYAFLISSGAPETWESGIRLRGEEPRPRDILDQPGDSTRFCWWIFCD